MPLTVNKAANSLLQALHGAAFFWTKKKNEEQISCTPDNHIAEANTSLNVASNARSQSYLAEVCVCVHGRVCGYDRDGAGMC